LEVRRHQALSEGVVTTNSFMKIGNVASIVCQMISVIILLFEITMIGVSNVFAGLISCTMFFVNLFGLSICIFSGVMVNYAVSYD
jgi:hypothetical protein